MPKLPVVSSREIIKILKKQGFKPAPKRGKGSHLAFTKMETDKTRLVIVPQSKEIPVGTLISILDQAGLSREQFISLL